MRAGQGGEIGASTRLDSTRVPGTGLAAVKWIEGSIGEKVLAYFDSDSPLFHLFPLIVISYFTACPCPSSDCK